MLFVRKLWADETGISSVEYALLLAFVAAGLIVGAGFLSTAVDDTLCASAAALDNTIICP